jgi:hypothetical protein
VLEGPVSALEGPASAFEGPVGSRLEGPVGAHCAKGKAAAVRARLPYKTPLRHQEKKTHSKIPITGISKAPGGKTPGPGRTNSGSWGGLFLERRGATRIFSCRISK